MSYGIVYKITNSINGKNYIGQTTGSLTKRWANHRYASKKGNFPIQRAIRLYGEENFIVEILQECLTKEDLDIQETYFVNLINCWAPEGYNLAAGNGNGKFSEASKEKNRNSQKGEKSKFFGIPRTQEVKDKISKTKTGKILSESHRQHMSEGRSTKTYYLTSPTGERVMITSMRKFCRENGFNRECMRGVISGKYNHHKGWTRDNDQ